MTDAIFGRHVAGRIVFLAAVALRFPAIVHGPTQGDELSYSAGGSIIAQGGLMYRDVVDHKPPLIYYTYGAVFAATWDFNLVGVQMLAMLFIALTALVIGATVRRFSAHDAAESAAPLAAIAYVFFSPTFASFEALDTNAELFLNLPLAGALWAWLGVRSGGRLRLALLAGVCVAFAGMYKYQALAVVVAVAVDVVRTRAWQRGASRDAPFEQPDRSVRPHRRPERILCGALFACGLAAPWALLAGTYAAMGEFDAFWTWGVAHNFDFIAAGPPFIDAMTRFGTALAVVAAPAGLIWWAVVKECRARSTPALAFVAIWWAASWLAVVAGGRFYPHYFLVLLPPACLLAAKHLAALLDTNRRLILVATLVPALGLNVVQWARPSVEAAVTPNSWQSARDDADLARSIRLLTRPTDPIFVWGPAPGLYLASERTPASRFIFWDFVAGVMPGSAPVAPNASALTTLILDLAHSRPRVIVDVGPLPFAHAPALASYVTSNYRLDSTYKDARLYVLK